MFNIKKICLITPNLLPVPNVLGGAIETLVTNILKEQTVENEIDITIVSIYNKLAYQESRKYKNTKVIYIKKDFKYIVYGLFSIRSSGERNLWTKQRNLKKVSES